MKTKFIFTATAVMLSLCSFAQTKGTNAIGLGITSYNSEIINTSGTQKDKQNLFSLSYGHFIADNKKLGFTAYFGKSTSESVGTASSLSSTKSFGAEANYQRYFPLIKTFYAYAAGKVSYFNEDSNNPSGQSAKLNSYTAGAYGGLTWFLSKRFALETNLLSANAIINKVNASSGSGSGSSTLSSTSFSLNTEGAISNLGFKIYFLL